MVRVTGLRAIHKAKRLKSIAPISVSIWAASEMRAKLLAYHPPINSTAMKMRVIKMALRIAWGAWPSKWCACPPRKEWL
jgi:hypothetical protein